MTKKSKAYLDLNKSVLENQYVVFVEGELFA